MRDLNELAERLNGMRPDQHLLLSARDIDDMSDGTLAAEHVERAMANRLIEGTAAFEFRVGPTMAGRHGLYISRRAATTAPMIDDAQAAADLNDRTNRWKDHMTRFAEAHQGQTHGALLIELERTESWTKIMGAYAVVLTAPTVWS